MPDTFSARAFGPGPSSANRDDGDGRVSVLRGAGVSVDARRAGRAVIALCYVALVVLMAALYIAGAEKNGQIANLRANGVPAKLKVTGCLGDMGGSGSNLVGYSCRGTFSLHGKSYSVSLPGNTLQPTGSVVSIVTVPSDPALISTPTILAQERSSIRVYVLPIILTVILVMATGLLYWKRNSADAFFSRRSRA